MESRISRRRFLKKSAMAVGAAAVCDIGRIVGADQRDGPSALPDGSKENSMPHVAVKLFPGRTEQQKIQLAEQITRDVVEIIRCDESSVSVSIEDVSPADWAEHVYKPDIIDKADKLYKKPGYKM